VHDIWVITDLSRVLKTLRILVEQGVIQRLDETLKDLTVWNVFVEDIRDSYPVRVGEQGFARNYESQFLEAFLYRWRCIIIVGLDVVVFLVLDFIVLDLRYFGRSTIGVCQIEKELDWFLPTSNSNRLAAKDCRERGQPLLAVKQKLMARERARSLLNGKITAGHLAIGLPNQDCPGWITTVEGVEEVSNARGAPNVTSLHLG